VPASGRGERGHRRVEREQIGPTGIDTAEQRLDQPFDHRAAHPVRDMLPDGDVAGQR
jgi:hypothetical protein